MSSASGDRPPSRRKKRREAEKLTPQGAGQMLREARERLGIDLAEVHDRTGISWRNLEALEAGDLTRFSEPSSAAIAMRRYADLVDLDSATLIKSLENPIAGYSGSANASGGASVGTSVTSGMAGLSAGTSRTRAVAAQLEPAQTTHLRHYESDRGNLRSFTQTAEVPIVEGSPGFYPQRHRRRKAPIGLRLLTWLLLLLLVVGGAGLSVYHYKPQWLRDIHVLKTHTKTPIVAAPHTKTTSPEHVTTPTTQPVRTTSVGVGTASVDVAVANYTVVVTATAPCWVEAQVPVSEKPLVNHTLVGGQSVSIPVTGGQLSLTLGSVAAKITIEVGGKPQFWLLRPNGVPFVVTFTNA